MQEDGFSPLLAVWGKIMEKETSCQFLSHNSFMVWLVLQSSLYKTLSNGQWSLQVMPVNRMLTCWCGFVQRECDRSATENTATEGTVALKAAWHGCRVMDQCWQRRKNYCFATNHMVGSDLMCKGGMYIKLMLHFFSVLDWRRYKCSKVESTKALTLTLHSRMIAMHYLPTSVANKIRGKRGERHNLMKVTGCHVLPRSFIRGSTLIVKLVYEAIFPSGEAMPTWASYILRLVGFLGRGWICWRGNQNWTENHYEVQHFFQKTAKNTVHLVSNYEP